MSSGTGSSTGDGDQTAPAGRDEVAAADAALRPAPEVAQAVRAACQRLFGIEASFLDSYHASLVHLVPIIRQTTPDDGRAIADGLARSVLWAALTDDPPEVVEATFQSVGAEYYRQGFPQEGYHGAGHALLRSAREVYTAEWSSELSSGWVAYFAWLGAHLQAGARQARQAGVPSPITSVPDYTSSDRAPAAGPAHAAGPADAYASDGEPAEQDFDHWRSTPPGDAGPPAEVPQPRPDAPQRGWRRVVPNLFR